MELNKHVHILLVYIVLGNSKTILNSKFSDIFPVIKVKILSLSLSVVK